MQHQGQLPEKINQIGTPDRGIIAGREKQEIFFKCSPAPAASTKHHAFVYLQDKDGTLAQETHHILFALGLDLPLLLRSLTVKPCVTVYCHSDPTIP